ncbi:MlaD family protein [Undibacterium sp.]|uniref:MlaD family protein n=1 Tax=Undibacterium sp. TaxID=1914977 RepID=UPI0025E025B2|nr:MlaD family protein [Undibacterium sp.]
MESRSHALMAGFFTIALIALTTVFALWLGRDRIQRTPYLIATKLSVAGLNLQAAVRYKGIKVGNVTDIDFDDSNPGQILLRIDVLPDTPVTPATFATLGYQGVTGIAYVQLDEDTTSSPASALEKISGMQRIPLRPGMMQNLEQRGMAILNQTEELSKRLNSLLDPDNRKSLVTAVDNIGRAAAAWQTVPGKLEPTLDKLPVLIEQVQGSAAAFKLFSADASRMSNNFNLLASKLQASDGTVAKLNLAADYISEGVTQETLPAINSLSREARSSMRSLTRAVENLNDRPQSILFGNNAAQPGPGEAGFVAPK